MTNTNDSDAGSLRDAISAAASGDTINFNLSGCPCIITLTSGQLAIGKTLTITGPASPDGSNGWFKSNVTIGLSATDDTDGSGVKSSTCSASGAQTIASTTINADSTSLNITSKGTTTLSYFATDNAGNNETAKTLTIKLDKTAPVINGPTPARAPDANGYYNHMITFGGDCSDTVSFLDFSSVNPVPPYSRPDSNSASVTASCRDNAGNLGSNTFTFKYDAIPPSITASATKADGSTYTGGTWTNQSVTVSFSCSDNLSGLDGSCPRPLHDGSDVRQPLHAVGELLDRTGSGQRLVRQTGGS